MDYDSLNQELKDSSNQAQARANRENAILNRDAQKYGKRGDDARKELEKRDDQAGEAMVRRIVQEEMSKLRIASKYISGNGRDGFTLNLPDIPTTATAVCNADKTITIKFN